jgi:hypothetical protein
MITVVMHADEIDVEADAVVEQREHGADPFLESEA